MDVETELRDVRHIPLAVLAKMDAPVIDLDQGVPVAAFNSSI